MINRFTGREIGKLFFIILLPFLLSTHGCGGGGGDGGGAGSGTTGTTYSGITIQAAIDQDNATDLAEGAYTGGKVGSSVGSIGVVQDTQIGRPLYLKLTQAIETAIRQIDVHAPPGVVELGAIVSESGNIPGDCGGNASYAIQADDVTGEFSGNISFNSYCSGGVTLTGGTSFSGTFDIDTDQLSQFNLVFNSLTGTMGTDSFTLEGTIAYTLQTATSCRITLDLRLRDNGTGKVYWVNNYAMAVSEGSSYIQFQVNGRFYDPDYGYVDISTPTLFRINSGQNWPSQGVMILIGSNGTKARLTANPNSTFVVDADTDGNGSYDWTSGNLNW
jgi:hypothetical protein